MKESVRSLRWSWVGFGWFIAVSIASMILLALTALGVVGAGREGEAIWIALAMIVGFFISAFFVGTRVVAAPLLHATSMTLFSVVAWVAINLVIGEPVGETTWRSVNPAALAVLLVLQFVAAAAGARMGVHWMRQPVNHT